MNRNTFKFYKKKSNFAQKDVLRTVTSCIV